MFIKVLVIHSKWYKHILVLYKQKHSIFPVQHGVDHTDTLLMLKTGGLSK